MLEIKQKRINQYSWAMDLMVGDRYTYPEKCKKSDTYNRFVMLLYTCKAHFTSGNADYSSVAGKVFFDEFIKQKNTKVTCRAYKDI